MPSLKHILLATGCIVILVIAIPAMVTAGTAHEPSPNQDAIGDEQPADTDVGICVVGAGGPCNGDGPPANDTVDTDQPPRS